ncbi:MAG: TIGR00730 family Rossman fold protein [Geminicoccaceae bacterium]
MFSVCVFCGSRFGRDPGHERDARELGRMIGERGWRLVYGGGSVGLMGVVADSVMTSGGSVLGIIPQRLMQREVGKGDISELVVSRGMFDRKERMIAESDSFVAMPGGLGTLDELFEVLTLKQLGYHEKPILLLDRGGFWSQTTALVDHVIAQEFAAADAASLMECIDDVPDIIRRLGNINA